MDKDRQTLVRKVRTEAEKRRTPVWYDHKENKWYLRTSNGTFGTTLEQIAQWLGIKVEGGK